MGCGDCAVSEDVLLQKWDGKLIGSDSHSEEFLATISNGEVVRCEIVRPRNERHHRLAFALMREVFKNQSMYATFQCFYDAIKMATGCFDTYYVQDFDGVYRETRRMRSLAWHMMDQTEFEEWWNKLLDVILKYILPATARADLEKRVYDMLGERGPE